MKTLTTPANAAIAAVLPHQTGAFPLGDTGQPRLSATPGSTYRPTFGHVTDAAAYTCRVAIDASGAEQWMNSTKFGPFYHFQRWKFAP